MARIKFKSLKDGVQVSVKLRRLSFVNDVKLNEDNVLEILKGHWVNWGALLSRFNFNKKQPFLIYKVENDYVKLAVTEWEIQPLSVTKKKITIRRENSWNKDIILTISKNDFFKLINKKRLVVDSDLANKFLDQ